LDSIGPLSAASVIEEKTGGDREIARRDAFEQVDALVRGLGI
jgi:hypothetical protein